MVIIEIPPDNSNCNTYVIEHFTIGILYNMKSSKSLNQLFMKQHRECKTVDSVRFES